MRKNVRSVYAVLEIFEGGDEEVSDVFSTLEEAKEHYKGVVEEMEEGEKGYDEIISFSIWSFKRSKLLNHRNRKREVGVD